jgi:hypothetical protein
MSLVRAIARISAVMCVVGLTAIGQQESAPHQPDPKTQIERCGAGMPVILKNYNDARYAVRRAGYSAESAHILGPVREAQAALDAMEEPLKVCTEAIQNMQGGRPQDDKK